MALGQVVLLTIHMHQLLGISLKYPLVYNSHRSQVIEHGRNETKCLPLYINAGSSSNYKTLSDAIKYLTRNLRNVLNALQRLKEREGIGRITNKSALEAQLKQPEATFQNWLLVILYHIAEFQVY